MDVFVTKACMYLFAAGGRGGEVPSRPLSLRCLLELMCLGPDCTVRGVWEDSRALMQTNPMLAEERGSVSFSNPAQVLKRGEPVPPLADASMWACRALHHRALHIRRRHRHRRARPRAWELHPRCGSCTWRLPLTTRPCERTLLGVYWSWSISSLAGCDAILAVAGSGI